MSDTERTSRDSEADRRAAASLYRRGSRPALSRSVRWETAPPKSLPVYFWELVAVLSRQRPVLAVFVLAGLVFGVVQYFRPAVGRFTAKGRLWVRWPDPLDSRMGWQGYVSIAVQAEMMRSAELARRVAERLSLRNHPAFLRDARLETGGSAKGDDRGGTSPLTGSMAGDTPLVRALRSRLRVSEDQSRSILTISCASESPDLAVAIVNEAGDVAVEMDLENKTKAAEQAVHFLERGLQDRAEVAESKKADFLDLANRLGVGILDTRTYSAEQSALSDQIAVLNKMRAELRAAEIQRGPGIGAPVIPADRRREEAIRKKLGELRKRLADLNELAWKYLRLKREMATSLEVPDEVVQRLRDTRLGMKVQRSNLIFVSRASVATASPSRSPGRALAASVIYGILLGVIAGLAVEQFRPRVRSASDLTQIAKLPVLGALPDLPSDTQPRPESIYVDDPRSAGAEVFRRVGLRLKTGELPGVLLVTSASPGEGKTVFALNVAALFGKSGVRVLLIEANDEGPRLGEFLGVDPSGVPQDGPSEGRRNAVVTTNLDHVDLIPARAMEKSPTTGLPPESDLRESLSWARGEYGLVIVDGAPLLANFETAYLAAETEHAVLVVREGVTLRHDVHEATRRLREVGAHTLGAFLNFAEVERRAGVHV